MNEIKTLAIDLAKDVFQLHGVDERGQAVLRRQVRRAQLTGVLVQLPPCTVAMEACAGAHYWGRLFTSYGHRVHLIPPHYVKAFNRGQKNDRNDAQAIAEAASRPQMARVAVKSEEQQAILALHRMRERLVKERTALRNQLHGLLLELGILLPRGHLRMLKRLAELLAEEHLPALLRPTLHRQREHLLQLDALIEPMSKQLHQLAQQSEPCRRLMQRRGVGPITATAFAAEIGDPATFKNGRQVAAWLGLVPRQYSSGARTVLLGITKRGNSYLRQLLVHGARSALQVAPRHPEDTLCRWALAVRERRGANRASVALANKTARQLWATLRYAEAA